MSRRAQLSQGGPDGFRVARREFERWRGAGRPGGRIPDRLWKLVVGLARVHGCWRTSRELGLDSAAVKKKLSVAEEARCEPGEIGPREAFVEIPGWKIAQAPECVVELADEAGGTGGTRMRIAIKGASIGEVAALAVSLWSGRR